MSCDYSIRVCVCLYNVRDTCPHATHVAHVPVTVYNIIITIIYITVILCKTSVRANATSPTRAIYNIPRAVSGAFAINEAHRPYTHVLCSGRIDGVPIIMAIITQADAHTYSEYYTHLHAVYRVRGIQVQIVRYSTFI